jgi:hypothetical protein
MGPPASIADYSVVIDNVTYSLLTIPDAKSALVAEERARVLRNINLEKLVGDLELCKDLLYLAYNGVAGFGKLQAAMSIFHISFSKLCGDCEAELGNIERQSRQILEKLKLVFTFLLKNKEVQALTFLKGCGAIAAKLAENSKALSKRFEELSAGATQILADTQIVQGETAESKKRLEERLNELAARTAGAESLVAGIAKQKIQLEKLYQEAKEKSELAENRAFTLAIVGAIFKPIAAGIGAFGAVYVGGGANAAAKKLTQTPPNLPPSKAAAEGEAQAAKQEVDEAQQQEKASDEEVQEAETEKKAADRALITAEQAVAAVKKEFESNPKDPKAASKLTSAETDRKLAAIDVEVAEKMLAEHKQEQSAARNRTEKAGAAFKAAEHAVTAAADAIEKIGDDYAQLATTYLKEKQTYLSMLMQKQDLENEALASIQEYAVRMQHTSAEVQTIGLAYDSLFQAVGALKQVAVILQDAGRFWDNMAAACRALADNSLAEIIEAYSTVDAEERLAAFKDQDFKEQVVRYYAGWKAIEIVSKQYAVHADQIRNAVNADFKKNLSIEEARNTAIKLGGQLAETTQRSLNLNAAATQELMEEKTALRQAS